MIIIYIRSAISKTRRQFDSSPRSCCIINLKISARNFMWKINLKTYSILEQKGLKTTRREDKWQGM